VLKKSEWTKEDNGALRFLARDFEQSEQVEQDFYISLYIRELDPEELVSLIFKSCKHLLPYHLNIDVSILLAKRPIFHDRNICSSSTFHNFKRGL